jgi:hypothetical protein
MVGKFIRDQINDLDEIRQREWKATMDIDGEAEDEAPQDTGVQQDNVALGSKQRVISFQELEDEKKEDSAFHRFRIRLAQFLTDFLPTYGLQLPRGKAVKLAPNDQASHLHGILESISTHLL